MSATIPRRIAISPLAAAGCEAWVQRALKPVPWAADAVMLRVEPFSPRDVERWIAALRGRGLAVVLHQRCAGAADRPDCDLVALHLPEAADARAWRGRVRGRLGQSVHSLDAARAAAEAGCDYVMLSPVFRPSSKPDDSRPTLGIPGLAAVCAAVSVPVIALGGVRPPNEAACLAAGAWGVAGMGGWAP